MIARKPHLDPGVTPGGGGASKDQPTPPEDPVIRTMPVGPTAETIDRLRARDTGDASIGTALDLQLLRAFRAGDPVAFDRLFLRHQDYVYNVCLGVLGNVEDASDCTQEVFVQVYRRAGSFQGRASFSTWLYRVAVNVCLGQLRRRPKTQPSPLDAPGVREVPDGASPPGAALERDADGQRVREVVAALNPDYRVVLVLHYFQGLSYEETAEVIGC